jgi:methionyl-tRNA formyltransferase
MAVPPLEALVDAGFDVAAVVTRADKRRGRGSALTPSPVKEAALRLGLPVVHKVDEVLDASERTSGSSSRSGS